MREFGYCSFPNVYDCAIAEFDHAVFVELGVWAGSSAEYMARRIRDFKKDIKFYCVDKWVQTPEMGRVDGDIYEIFSENLSHLHGYYIPLRSDTTEAANLFENNSVDFCFVDACHDYNSVVGDIQAWLPKMKLGGLLAGHDIDVVTRAVTDTLPNWEFAGENCWRWRK